MKSKQSSIVDQLILILLHGKLNIVRIIIKIINRIKNGKKRKKRKKDLKNV